MGLEELIGNPLHDWEVGHTIPYNYSWDHPLYTENAEIWETCRDACAGQHAIKKKGTRYLPKLNSQKTAEYNNYKNRANYYNATGRTLQSYEGMIFRKDPIVNMKNKESGDESTSIDKVKYFNRITNKGKSLSALLHDTVGEIIQTNRTGILVDYPRHPKMDDPQGFSRYDKERLDYKPTLTMYPAETIVNWQTVYDHDKPIPVMYVLKEVVYDYQANGIFPTEIDSYRILSLEPYIADSGELKARYKQSFFKETYTGQGRDRKAMLQLADVVYPLKNGDYLERIPFFVLTDKGIEFENITTPIIYDLAELNLSHYKNSADWENELHMVACKTIYFPGWDKKAFGNPRFGGALAGPENCVPQMIEASNKSGLADEMKNKEERMSVLGSEAISKQGRYVSSAATAKISSKAEASILTTMAVSLSAAFSEILTFLLEWDEHEDLVAEVVLNTDYYDEQVSGEELMKWMRVWQGGGLSFDAYYNMLEKREAYPANWTKEKEAKRIKKSMEDLMNLPDEKYNIVMAKIMELTNANKMFESYGLTGLVSDHIEDLAEGVTQTNMKTSVSLDGNINNEVAFTEEGETPPIPHGPSTEPDETRVDV
jgi:hypothetical protein